MVRSRLLAGKPIILPRDGDAAVQFVHEGDLGAAVCLLVDQNRRGRAIFNITDREVLSLSGLSLDRTHQVFASRHHDHFGA